MDQVTMEVAGAQLTVSTEALFRAWLQQQVTNPAAAPSFMSIPAPTPGVGERFVATILLPNRTGKHIYLRPEKSDKNNWQHQMDWASSIGADLPDQVEGALLFSTMPEEFEKEAYWLNKQHAARSYHAWFQDFEAGRQHDWDKAYELRARAVRREQFTY